MRKLRVFAVLHSVLMPLLCGSELILAEDQPSIPNIPKQFHGTWDTQGSCKEQMSDSRMVVETNMIVYFEMACALKRIDMSGNDIFSGQFACAGEGERWGESVSLKIENNHLIEKNRGTVVKRSRCN